MMFKYMVFLLCQCIQKPFKSSLSAVLINKISENFEKFEVDFGGGIYY